jgi:hypothetical protein
MSGIGKTVETENSFVVEIAVQDGIDSSLFSFSVPLYFDSVSTILFH